MQRPAPPWLTTPHASRYDLTEGGRLNLLDDFHAQMQALLRAESPQ